MSEIRSIIQGQEIFRVALLRNHYYAYPARRQSTRCNTKASLLSEHYLMEDVKKEFTSSFYLLYVSIH